MSKYFKKLNLVLLSLLLFSSMAYAKMTKIVFMKNGSYVGKINTYILNDNIYMDASRTAKLLGGKIYWYPVSGKLFFQVKGNKIVFYRDKDEIILNKKRVSVPRPYIVRGGKAFISKDFLTSKHFSTAFNFRLAYNEKTGIIEEAHSVNINSMNHFSYKDRTRMVIYMSEKLKFQESLKERNLLSINILDGVLYDTEKISINNGIIKNIEMFQENKYARFGISLGQNFKEYKSFTLKNPDRLIFDIYGVNAAGNKNDIAPPIIEPSADANDSDIPVIAPPSNSVKEGAGAAPEITVNGGASSMVPSFLGSPSVLSNVGQNSNQEKESSKKLSSREKPNIPDKMVLSKSGIKRIVIDPGHGGRDGGGRQIFGLKEKTLNLKVAKLLLWKLEKVKGFKVLLTRDSDVFVPLRKRSKIANDYGADLFISIHANASRHKRNQGFEIYFMSENASDPWAAEVADYENSVIRFEEKTEEPDPAALLLHSLARNEYMNEGSKLAGYVAKEFDKRTPFVNRGVKQAAFYVLRGTYAPGILVEMGFMTNRKDQTNLCKLSVRKKIADSIYRGVLNYAKSKNWK
ncbi:MAG: N-acetylmuramoyl-L-alanine amidase [Elusimicrobiales bacterium]|nr:N-acetylmuramoyl-L-alanine amidase [Elusimicrobiales bacterium]